MSVPRTAASVSTLTLLSRVRYTVVLTGSWGEIRSMQSRLSISRLAYLFVRTIFGGFVSLRSGEEGMGAHPAKLVPALCRRAPRKIRYLLTILLSASRRHRPQQARLHPTSV